MHIRKMGLMLILILTLIGCSREPKIKEGHLLTVKKQSATDHLYYSGTVQPLATSVITSPADGVIVEMPFQYGESVKADQLVFVISSSKFLADYKAALLQYIKAKNEFNGAQTQMTEGTFLHKNQLISDDEFKLKQSNYYASQLGLLQAKDTLENLLRQLAVKDVDLYKLTIADIDKITQAMHFQMTSENLRIRSPVQGVLLAPNKSEEENKKIQKGDVVKQGDVLAVIGDLSGLTVRIKVNELTVNQLKVGQRVSVSGIAFGDTVLTGEISRLDRQGEAANGGLPTFGAEVIVKRLTPVEANIIHVGMSAKVEILLQDDPNILLPLAAVFDTNGQAYVKRYDPRTQAIKNVPVKAGKTTLDQVAILSGLQEGDAIVIPN